jgi:hypothetical protein
MQLFLYLLSKSFGDSLVKTAFFLMKPQHLIDPADISSDVGSVIKHPTADQYAWDFSDDPLLIHPEADPHGLDAILDALIAAGACLPGEKQETQNRITAALGTFKTILDILPQSLAPLVKTFEQMDAEGWFHET